MSILFIVSHHQLQSFALLKHHQLYHNIYYFSTCFSTYAVFCEALTSFSSILFILSFMVSFASSLKCTLTQYIVPPICFLSAIGVFAFLFSICLLSFCDNVRQGSASIFRQRTTTTDTKKLLFLIFYSFIFTFKLFSFIPLSSLSELHIPSKNIVNIRVLTI